MTKDIKAYCVVNALALLSKDDFYEAQAIWDEHDSEKAMVWAHGHSAVDVAYHVGLTIAYAIDDNKDSYIEHFVVARAYAGAEKEKWGNEYEKHMSSKIKALNDVIKFLLDQG